MICPKWQVECDYCEKTILVPYGCGNVLRLEKILSELGWCKRQDVVPPFYHLELDITLCPECVAKKQE